MSLHTDGLHEAGELEDTVAAIAGRTVHAYHVEGTGGGHVPDLIGLVREANVLCSSTTPTLPYGLGTAAEHLAMTLLNHGGNPWLPADVALVRERIHPATMAAEGPLHELGAIGIVNSDSQGMGRIGEVLRRTLQLAHVMKAWRATEAGSAGRTCPTTAATRSTTTPGSCATWPRSRSSPRSPTASPTTSARSSRADWPTSSCGSRRFFGVKPEVVLKAGAPGLGPARRGQRQPSSARSRRATSPTGPVMAWRRRMSGSTFVSAAALDGGLARRASARRRRLVAVHGCRGLTRASLCVEPGDGADRGRPGRRDRDARRPDAGRRAGRRGPAQPALPAALTVSSDPG